MIRYFFFLVAMLVALASCKEETKEADVADRPGEVDIPERSEHNSGNSVASETDSPASSPVPEPAKALNLDYQPSDLKSEDYLQASETSDARDLMGQDTGNYPELFDKKEKKEKNITVKPLLSEERDPNLDLSINSLKESISGAEVSIRKDIE